ncbi:C-X-C motif chemokine 10 [Ctenodactylus gundi]
MNHSAVFIFCLMLLALSMTQGIPHTRIVRCTCITISSQPVNPKALEKLEIIPASSSCPQVEIIATMKKSGKKRCLNPESKSIKNLLKAVSKESQLPKQGLGTKVLNRPNPAAVALALDPRTQLLTGQQ